MGNHPHRAYRDESTVKLGNKYYSKRDLEIIQQRLLQKKELQGTKSNSLTRQNNKSMANLRETNASMTKSSQVKQRPVTPNQNYSHATFSTSPTSIGALARAFDPIDYSSYMTKKNNLRKSTLKSTITPSRSQDTQLVQMASSPESRNQTTVDCKSFVTKPASLNNSLIQNDNKNSLVNSSSSQDLFDQILESRDKVNDVNEYDKTNQFLESYYRKNKLNERALTVRQTRKATDQSQSSEDESQTPSTQGTSRLNKFAIRMQRHMQHTNATYEDTSSSQSQSQRDTLQSRKGAASNELDFDNFNFSRIPAMSSDGMFRKDTNTTEGDEEGVMEQGEDYKLSIMKSKRPLIADDPFEQEEVKEVQKVAVTELKTSVLNEQSTQLESQAEADAHNLANENDDTQIKVRSEDSIRSKLMDKLSMNRMADPNVSNKPKSHQSIFIWDWDDTLMASTFLAPYQSQILKNNIRKKLSKQTIQQLDQLENVAIQLLKKSLRFGKTYIITNAGSGWVELSSSRFLPKLYKELLMNSKANGITIVSARALYEKQIPNGFKEWKQKTFLQLAADMDKDIITNIVAIGDSQIEIDAASIFSEQFKEAYLKTVKLKEQPNIVELLRQVELILHQFEEICSCAKNLTIRLQKVEDEQKKE